MALIGVQEPRRATPCFDLVLCRHVPPVQVLVLKNSIFELMARTALLVREPPHRSDPQSVESPNGPGNPSGYCDPTRDLRWQPPGFAAGTQGGAACAPTGAQGAPIRDSNRSRFAAGSQGWRRPGPHASPSPSAAKRPSELLTAPSPPTPSSAECYTR